MWVPMEARCKDVRPIRAGIADSELLVLQRTILNYRVSRPSPVQIYSELKSFWEAFFPKLPYTHLGLTGRGFSQQKPTGRLSSRILSP